MEDLNKNQIVLLTLLVSFVTSIATGIMTVSLLQEAPIEVTRTINRVVEKTIETVVPSAVTPTVTKPTEVTTVVVKEEDLVIDSINKNLKSIARISETDSVGESFYGIGLVISKDGLIAADRKTIDSTHTYSASMSDGTELTLTPQGVSKETNFILFKGALPEKKDTSSTTPKVVYTFVTATFSDISPKLGQTLIGLGGSVKNSVNVGRVVSLDMKTSGTGTSTTQTLSGINTDISAKDLVNGSPVFNLSGDLVGIRLGTDIAGSFTPILVLKKEIPTLTEPPKAQ